MMTYWQELRREWFGSAATGGILAWLCLMFIAAGDQYSEWGKNALSFMFAWPLMFAADIGLVWIKRMFRK